MDFVMLFFNKGHNDKKFPLWHVHISNRIIVRIGRNLYKKRKF
jgi:hypothetical protein